MPNEGTDERGRDPRTARERIADAIIPRHCCFARGAYLLGNDAALLGFLAIPEYDESRTGQISVAITDEMIDAAAQEICDSGIIPDPCYPHRVREAAREIMKAALTILVARRSPVLVRPGPANPD